MKSTTNNPPSAAGKPALYFIELQTWLAIAALSVMVVINVAEVVIRFFFNYSLVWVQEITLLLSCWSVFLGFSSISYYHKDIVISMFVEKLPGRLRGAAEFIAYLANIFFMALLSYSAFCLLQLQAGDRSMVVRIPTNLFTYSLIISSVTIFFINVSDLVKLIKNRS